MKKVLLTTTALTMMAGAAYADVTVTGSGRIAVLSTPATAAVTVVATAIVAADVTALVALTPTVANTVAAADTYTVAEGKVQAQYGTDTALAAAVAAADLLLASATTTALVTVAQTAQTLAAKNVSDKAAALAIIGARAGSVTAATAAATVVQNRVRINIAASGSTDGGLTFGANTRLQIIGGAAGSIQGNSIWVSNGTMTLTVGNTSGAVATTSGFYAVGGCGFSASTSYGSYCANVLNQANPDFQTSSSGGTGPNNVRVDFALGSANLSLSGGTGLDTEVAANFSLGAIALGVGVDNGAGAAGGTSVSATYSADSGSVSLYVSQPKTGAQQYIVKGSMGVGSGTVGAFYANDDGGNRWGLNYGQSLGGGAAASIAIHNQTVAANGMSAGTTIAAGMTFGF